MILLLCITSILGLRVKLASFTITDTKFIAVALKNKVLWIGHHFKFLKLKIGCIKNEHEIEKSNLKRFKNIKGN